MCTSPGLATRVGLAPLVVGMIKGLAEAHSISGLKVTTTELSTKVSRNIEPRNLSLTTRPPPSSPMIHNRRNIVMNFSSSGQLPALANESQVKLRTAMTHLTTVVAMYSVLRLQQQQHLHHHQPLAQKTIQWDSMAYIWHCYFRFTLLLIDDLKWYNLVLRLARSFLLYRASSPFESTLLWFTHQFQIVDGHLMICANGKW